MEERGRQAGSRASRRVSRTFASSTAPALRMNDDACVRPASSRKLVSVTTRSPSTGRTWSTRYSTTKKSTDKQQLNVVRLRDRTSAP